MWRAFFSAVGIVLVILGVECMVIDQAILANPDASDPLQQAQVQTASLFGGGGSTSISGTTVFRPADWIPWSLLASGAITFLYSTSYRRM